MRTLQFPEKTNILGVGISTTSYAQVANTFRRWIEDRRRSSAIGMHSAPYVCVTSVHGIITAVLNRDFRSILNRAAIATPDGMPVVWALRSFGARGQSRVYGPDLMLALCEQAAALGHRIFLYGGRQETLNLLRSRLEARFPDLEICGTYSPPFRPLTPAEDAECIRMLREAEPDIIFVGLSTPKQERWMAEHCEAVPGCVLTGVGAAFDFHAGTLEQAPGWMQRAGLEWFFRLLMEPRRLWKRYILVTPLFLPLWALQKCGVLRFRE